MNAEELRRCLREQYIISFCFILVSGLFACGQYLVLHRWYDVVGVLAAVGAAVATVVSWWTTFHRREGAERP